jgi:hypothetical protein
MGHVTRECASESLNITTKQLMSSKLREADIAHCWEGVNTTNRRDLQSLYNATLMTLVKYYYLF